MLQSITYLSNTITLRFGAAVRLSGQVAYDAARVMLCFETDEDVEVLSVNLEAYGLVTPAGHAWIKDWSEHEGVAAQLIERGLVAYAATASVGPFNSPAHLVQINNTTN